MAPRLTRTTLRLRQSEIQAQDNAESVRVEREREAAASDYAKDAASKRAKLSALIADDLADTKEAEDSARKLAAAISRRLKRNPEMARLAHAISGQPAPICLQFTELMTRIGGWCGAILGAPLKPRGHAMKLAATSPHRTPNCVSVGLTRAAIRSTCSERRRRRGR